MGIGFFVSAICQIKVWSTWILAFLEHDISLTLCWASKIILMSSQALSVYLPVKGLVESYQPTSPVQRFPVKFTILSDVYHDKYLQLILFGNILRKLKMACDLNKITGKRIKGDRGSLSIYFWPIWILSMLILGNNLLYIGLGLHHYICMLHMREQTTIKTTKHGWKKVDTILDLIKKE